MSTPILGIAQVTQSTALAWAQARGGHARFLAVIPLYEEIAPRYGVRPEVAICQAAKETANGNYGGVVPPDYHNWCGLKTRAGGSNDDPNAHMRFPDDRAGVLAHIQHLCAYAGASAPVGDDPLLDPRFGLVAFGSAPDCEALGGRWAPSPDYGTELARLVADLVGQERPMANRPTDIYGIPVVWIPAANGNWDTQRAGADLVIVHDIEGGAPGAIGRFTTAGEQASTQLVLDPDQGRIVQMVDLDAVAYGCGNYPYNQRATQFEMPGYRGQPYRADVLDYAAKTIAYLCNRDNVPLVKLSSEQVAAGQRGVCGHENIPNQSHIDPGPTFPWEQVMAAASALLNGSPAPQPDNRFYPETGHNLSHGFKSFYDSYGDKALATFGYPISEEFRNADNIVVQYFERARFEWHPENQPPYDILLGRLGDEADERDRAAHPEAFAPQDEPK